MRFPSSDFQTPLSYKFKFLIFNQCLPKYDQIGYLPLAGLGAQNVHKPKYVLIYCSARRYLGRRATAKMQLACIQHFLPPERIRTISSKVWTKARSSNLLENTASRLADEMTECAQKTCWMRAKDTLNVRTNRSADWDLPADSRPKRNGRVDASLEK